MPEPEAGELRGPVTGEEPHLAPFELPDGARVVVTIQLALEAWAGTAVTGSVLGSALSEEAMSKGVPDWATISAQEYGGRTGMRRILALLRRTGIVASCSVSGLAAERWPDLVRSLSDEGHEVVGHGWSQDRRMSDMDEDEDYATIDRSSRVLEEVCGQRPVGWSSHGSRRGNFTISNLMKLGYRYTNDFRDADGPYVAAWRGSQPLVAMPRTDEVNDMFVVRRHGSPPSTYVEFFRRAFDQLYEEGEYTPRIVSCVAHGTLIGRPWGISALRECIEYARGFPNVQFMRRRDVAALYAASLPPSGDAENTSNH